MQYLRVLGKNGSGQYGKDKMVLGQIGIGHYGTDNMVYGQNGIDKMV